MSPTYMERVRYLERVRELQGAQVMERKPYPKIPSDGYMFQAFAEDRDPSRIPNDEWEICIPSSSDREGAAYIGCTIIDGSPCNVWRVGGGAAPDAFLACTIVFSGGY